VFLELKVVSAFYIGFRNLINSFTKCIKYKTYLKLAFRATVKVKNLIKSAGKLKKNKAPNLMKLTKTYTYVQLQIQPKERCRYTVGYV